MLEKDGVYRLLLPKSDCKGTTNRYNHRYKML